jgi:hypothetical protein
MKYLSLLLLTFALASAPAALGQGAVTPPGPPGPTMKSLQDLWDKLASVSQAQKYTAHVLADATVAGGKGTAAITNIVAGKLVKLESVTVTTYSDPSAIAYVKFLVKENTFTSRIMTMQIPLSAAINDPLTNTRNGTLQLPMWINGGGLNDVAVGDVHSVTVNVQSSAGVIATSSWVLTGQFATP